VRVDGLDRKYNALLLTDGYDPGNPPLGRSTKMARLMFSIAYPIPGEPDAKKEKTTRSITRRRFFDLTNQRRWHHVAVTYDNPKRRGGAISRRPGDQPRGEHLPSTRTPHPFWPPAKSANWGLPTQGHQFPIRNFNGRIDEFLIYQAALTPPENSRAVRKRKARMKRAASFSKTNLRTSSWRAPRPSVLEAGGSPPGTDGAGALQGRFFHFSIFSFLQLLFPPLRSLPTAPAELLYVPPHRAALRGKKNASPATATTRKRSRAVFDMRSLAAALQGGDSGEPAPQNRANPSKARCISPSPGAHEDDWKPMPPKEADKLYAEQVSWIKDWIAGGAPWPGGRPRVEEIAQANTAKMGGGRWSAGEDLGRTERGSGRIANTSPRPCGRINR